MRIHCLGPGSIGSLLCFHLRHHSHPINFILRKPQTQHRKSKTLSLQLERDSFTRSVEGIEYEFVGSQQQQPIESLLVTTKAQQVSRSLEPILHRLNQFSTVILLHNGLGVIEEIMERCFPQPQSRPSFILANTSHGVLKLDGGITPSSHGRFSHSGFGDIKLGVLPNQTVLDSLDELSRQDHWYPSSSSPFSTHRTFPDTISTLSLSKNSNPLMNPSISIAPNLEQHLPYLHPETHSLYRTLGALLRPEIVESLATKWLNMSDFQTSALVKLTVNAAINPMTALLEIRNEALGCDQGFVGLAKGICTEASSVFARQAGIQTGGFPIDHPLAESNLYRHVCGVMRATGSNISSMCADLRKLGTNRIDHRLKQSRLKGQKLRLLDQDRGTEDQDQDQVDDHTEIEYINGYISRLGKRYSLPTPLNDGLLGLVKLKCSVIVSDQRLDRLERSHQRVKPDEEVEIQEDREGLGDRVEK